MSLFEPLPGNAERMPLEHEITRLIDCYAELDCAHAFLMDSLTSIMSNPEPAQKNYIQGAKRFAETTQAREQELKGALEHIRQRYCSERCD